jgi:hypothetical protein
MRRDGALGARIGEEVVGVEALALERDEQVPGSSVRVSECTRCTCTLPSPTSLPPSSRRPAAG